MGIEVDTRCILTEGLTIRDEDRKRTVGLDVLEEVYPRRTSRV